MEQEKKKECTFEGKTYSHGEEVCVADKCMKCNDGEWEIVEVRESGAED